MNREELIAKATYKRILPNNSDIEYYFNVSDVEIGHYCKISKRVTVFKHGRIWDESIKKAYTLVPVE